MMYHIAILEPPGGKTTNLLVETLGAAKNPPSVVITRGGDMSGFTGEYDLFVVAPGEGERQTGEKTEISCRVLLVPGGVNPATVGKITSSWVVSYGLSGKDSLTVSSLEQDCAVLALQRELVTLEEQVLEQQELLIRFPARTSSERVMAVYGSLLILGLPVEALAETIHAQCEVEFSTGEE